MSMYVVFSILVKLLHNIFGHNTDCGVLFFAACFPATVLHDLLKEFLVC